jgi:hypothetical protein
MLFAAVQCLLALPVSFIFLRTPPSELYPRIHGGPNFDYFDRSWAAQIIVHENARGFTDGIELVPQKLESGYGHLVILANSFEAWAYDGLSPYLFAVTPDYIFYRDAQSLLSVPVHLIPAWVFREMDFPELFNHLALYNHYFSAIAAPVFVLIFVVFFITQIMITAAAVWLFGQWQKLTAVMTAWDRFAICTFASIPAGLIGFVAGIALPVVHIFIFQLLMIYFAYKAMKEFR